MEAKPYSWRPSLNDYASESVSLRLAIAILAGSQWIQKTLDLHNDWHEGWGVSPYVTSYIEMADAGG